MSVADKMADQFVPEVDPNPAEPRMVIWSTLRCLELQIDQHAELYDSHGVVSWELLKHMVRLAKRHAHEEGGKAQAAERETDQWRTRADEANAKLRETEQELQRLRAVIQTARRRLGQYVMWANPNDLRAALMELDANLSAILTSSVVKESATPTPVAERCPECDGSGMVDSGGFTPDGKGINVPCGGDCRGKPCPSQPTPATEPLDAEGGA